MFFVRGLSSRGTEVFVNPDQVLYVRAAGWRRQKAALVMTHGEHLIVDQDSETVRRRFEDYLKDIIDEGDDDPGDPEAGSGPHFPTN